MLDGVTPALAKRCLAAFAKMHAHYHGLPDRIREQRLPMSRHPFLSPAMSAISQSINVAAIEACRRKAPDLFTEAQGSHFRAAMSKWQHLQQAWYRGPLTLVHGDSPADRERRPDDRGACARARHGGTHRFRRVGPGAMTRTLGFPANVQCIQVVGDVARHSALTTTSADRTALSRSGIPG